MQWWCGGVCVCFHGNFQQTLRSFIIKNINFSSSLTNSRLPFVLFICFNVYIIVFYGSVVRSTREISSLFPSISFVCAFTMLRRNHMCLIFSTISLLPTCWNLWILWRRMEGFVEQRRKMWKGTLSSSIILSFVGELWAVTALLPFFAFKYYEPNITITTHYPSSYKANEMAMTKWLLCGVDLFRSCWRWNNFIYSVLLPSLHTHNRRVFHKSFWFYG